MQKLFATSLAAGLVLITACDPDRALGTDARSGSRLRGQYFVSASGARVPAGWIDLELGVGCAPRLAADGRLRCLPLGRVGAVAAAAQPGPGVGYEVYGDAACGTRLQAHGAACEAPPYAVVSVSDACGESRQQVFAVEGVTVPTMLYVLDPVTGCREYNANPAGSTYLRLGAEVPASSFVELQDGGNGQGGRIRQRLWEGTDGSRLPRDLYDADVEGACEILTAADGALRCLPQGLALSNYTDAECTAPAGRTVQVTETCGLPEWRYGRRALPTECWPVPQAVYVLGTPTSAVTPYLAYGDGVCEPNGLPPGAVGTVFAWPAEHEVAPGSLVAFAPESTPAEGRLQLQRVVDGQGFAAPSGPSFWDTLREEACHPSTVADGTVRCVPAWSALVRERYRDAQCTTLEKVGFVTANPTCLPATGTRYAGEHTDGCGGGARIYGLGASLPADTVYLRDAGGDCIPDPTGSYYAVGAEVPAADLAELTLVTD